MKTTRMMAVAVLIVGSGLALHAAWAQHPGIKRTDLQQHDLSVPGREVVQVRVDFAPGVGFPQQSSRGLVIPRVPLTIDDWACKKPTNVPAGERYLYDVSFLGMPDKAPPLYVVKIRPCTMHAGRFRWDIVDSGQPVQSSLDSYATIEGAWTAGRIEMGKLISRRWFGD